MKLLGCFLIRMGFFTGIDGWLHQDNLLLLANRPVQTKTGWVGIT